MKRKLWMGILIPVLLGAVPCHADPLKTSSAFDALPLPIQSYVLALGVEAGANDPADVETDKDAKFDVPVPNSDLNGDEKPDYYVNDCAFAPKQNPTAYQTNGFACAFGALLLSTDFGGYDIYKTSGTLEKAYPGENPTIKIYQRNFGNCGEASYMCLAAYAVDQEKHALRLAKTVSAK
jgi:hypothetical protein